MKKYKRFGKPKTLKELVSELEIPRQVRNKQFRAFEHFYNPLHLYSRLRELGISYFKARQISEDYEKNTYKSVVEELKKLSD